MSNLTCSYITTDANSAVASVAYRLNEIIAIYPITPSSSMAEQADIWAANNRKNIWQDTPKIIEMQSEAGAIATVHGALQTGALATTFTSSQGLLLMIPTLYKLAGQLQPFVLHVAARTVATHALSIFGDHSDVMAVRQTGCAMLCANNVQQAQDFAVIAQISALNSRLPFIHFFDGFRTSHEINKIHPISDEILQQLIPEQAIQEHRQRALSPEAPTIRGIAANPDTYFQAREAINPWYFQAYQHVLDAMQAFGNITGRYYQPFEYYGHPDAEQIIILMGSAAGPCEEVIDQLLTQNEKVGVVKVHLFRPFSAQHFLKVVPLAVKAIAVLDRTKEPGAQAEPLFLDIMTALAESFSQGQRDKLPKVISGRYGLSSKEFDPDCVITIFHQLKLAKPKTRFTIGLHDDVTGLSLPIIKASLPTTHKLAALFYGLGSDGSVSATKNTIKLIGNHTALFPQAYFVYDSKKAGGLTVSHLRINHHPFYSSYLIKQADFIGCHQWQFIHKYQLIEKLKPGGIFLINSPYKSDQIWHHLPQEIQYLLRQKQAQCYTINAYQIARQCQLGGRINTIMQTAFFYLTQLLPMSEAKQQLKETISQSYCKKGADVVENNINAVDLTIKAIEKFDLQEIDITSLCRPATVADDAPDFVKNITAKMIADLGDTLPVSVFPPDGSWPTGTTKWEKRNIAETIPIWQPALCTQCNYCVAACPHAAIRAKVTSAEILEAAPPSLPSLAVKSRDMRGLNYVLQVAPEDCTGCNLCYEVCPAKDRQNPQIRAINMQPRVEHLIAEKINFNFFLQIPDIAPHQLERIDIRTSQLITPLFEYSGACAGCGETPYIKLLTQLYGDRLLIANATGCSSIYGGNLPTSPYSKNNEGRGPAWANSLFEDNAEFGLGFRLTLEQHKKRVSRLLNGLAEQLPNTLINQLQDDSLSIELKRQLIVQLQSLLNKINTAEAQQLSTDAHYLIDKSVWIIGGDGWAYDIGYGGLDHVLNSGENINVLVLDTQCYSNTGGQQSKATPIGAVTKFGQNGKQKSRKDLGITMMMYGHVYVAQIAIGAQMNQTVKAIQEAASYAGPSLIIAYSPCEEHGYDLAYSHEQSKQLTAAGFWPLYRFDPQRSQAGKPALILDSRAPTASLTDILQKEQRFSQLTRQLPEQAEILAKQAEIAAQKRYTLLELLAKQDSN